MKITQFKLNGKGKTQKSVELVTLLESMKKERAEKLAYVFRYSLQYIDRKTRSAHVNKIPELSFATEFKKTDAGQVMVHYNGVVLLEINHLAGMEAAASVRNAVARLPQTLAAFVGLSGKSVKFLVAFTYPDGALPQLQADAELFHMNAYRKAVRFYEELISYKVTLKRPSLDHTCRLSYDPCLYFNEEAHPIFLKQPAEMSAETTYEETVREELDPLLRLMPGQQLNGVVSAAQALSEIQNGERYWFNDEDEAILTKNNESFEVQPPVEQLFLQYYRVAEEGETGEKLRAVEILTRLQKKSGFKLSDTKISTFGRILTKLNVPLNETNQGRKYSVIEC